MRQGGLLAVLACVMSTGCADAFTGQLIDQARPFDAGPSDTGVALEAAAPDGDAGMVEADAQDDAPDSGSVTDAAPEADAQTACMTGEPGTDWKADNAGTCFVLDDGVCPPCAPYGYACAAPQAYPPDLNPKNAIVVAPDGGLARLCSADFACARAEQADNLCPGAHAFYCTGGRQIAQGCTRPSGVTPPVDCCP